MKNKLHIFTLSWNGLDKLQRLKESMLPGLKKAKVDWHWHIKSNGCSDNTPENVNTWGDRITCYEYKNNMQNFSEGNNYLFDLVQPEDDDYVLLLNNDVIFNDNKSLKKMIDLFESQKNVGVVGAKLKYKDTNKLQHAGVVFSSMTRNLPAHFRSGHIDDKDSSKNREFQVVTGAVLLTKAKYYKNVCTENKSNINGMDEKFIWAFDDIAMCLAIKYNQNKRILYCGSTDIFHEESVTLQKNPTNKLFMPQNMRRMIEKWGKTYELDAEKYNNPNYNVI